MSATKASLNSKLKPSSFVDLLLYPSHGADPGIRLTWEYQQIM